MKFILTSLLFCLPSLANAQTIAMPDKVLVPVNRMAAVTIQYEGAKLDWWANGAIDADIFREYDPNPGVVRLRILAYRQQIIYLNAVSTRADNSAKGVTIIVVGDPGPEPPIPPKPDPPIPPKPEPPKPDPVNPAPIPLPGLRVLIVYETAENLPPAQGSIIFGAPFRTWLESIVVKGADGKTPERRIWDKDVDVRAAPKHWQDVMARPRASIPWLVVSNGVTGFEGPLPATVEETKKLIQKYNPSMEKK